MQRFTQIIAVAIIVSFSAGTLTPALANAQAASDAVRECTVDALLGSIGGKVLGAIGNVAKGALDVAKAIPGVGSIVSGIGSIFGIGGGDSTGTSADNPTYVKESGEQGQEVKKLQFDTCVKAIKDTVFKVALAKLKKRLLDRMTDDIISWINGNGDPKFITNFGDYLEDAAQAAVGDTARAIGLAELCTPFKYRLPALLKPIPTFSQRASCTLDDIVENIEGFYEDFRSGGPLAYVESLSPNNNPIGTLFATRDQVIRETAKKQEAAALAASAGGGYKPIEQCLEWSATSYRVSLSAPRSTSRAVNSSFDYPNPAFPPPAGSAAYTSVEEALGGGPIVFTCSRKEITLPPGGTQQIAAVALTADSQVVANSDDLSPYVNAIFDAAVNRIIKEGVKGLRGSLSNLRSESGTGRAAEPYPEGDPYRDYGEEYQNATNFSAQLRTELQRNITAARGEIQTASTSLARIAALNLELIATTTALADCQETRLGAACTNTTSSLAELKQKSAELAVNRTSLTTALEGIQDIEDALAADPNMSEGALRALLSTLGSVRLSLQTSITQQKAVETLFEDGIKGVGEELKACRTGTYSCNWTP